MLKKVVSTAYLPMLSGAISYIILPLMATISALSTLHLPPLPPSLAPSHALLSCEAPHFVHAARGHPCFDTKIGLTGCAKRLQ